LGLLWLDVGLMSATVMFVGRRRQMSGEGKCPTFSATAAHSVNRSAQLCTNWLD